jgi:hypothetical protein
MMCESVVLVVYLPCRCQLGADLVAYAVIMWLAQLALVLGQSMPVLHKLPKAVEHIYVSCLLSVPSHYLKESNNIYYKLA